MKLKYLQIVNLIDIHNELINDSVNSHFSHSIYDLISHLLYSSGYSTFQPEALINDYYTMYHTDQDEDFIKYLSLFTDSTESDLNNKFSLVKMDADLISQALFAAKQTKFPEIISADGESVEIVIKKEAVLPNLLKLNIIRPKYETNHLNYNA
jgi:hypothetical protein